MVFITVFPTKIMPKLTIGIKKRRKIVVIALLKTFKPNDHHSIVTFTK